MKKSNRSSLNKVSNLRFIRHIFDNSRRDEEAVRAVNDFVFHCINENGLPMCIRHTLGQANSDFRHLYPTNALFEEFPENGISQIGVTAQVDFLGNKKSGIMQIECKANESFGRTIDEVFDDHEDEELEEFCRAFGVKEKEIRDVPYSLLDRAYRLSLMSDDKRADCAVLVIHSFSESNKYFKEFKAFSETIGIPVKAPGMLSKPKTMYFTHDSSVELYLAWVQDKKYPIDA